jgi:hypothetical protein
MRRQASGVRRQVSGVRRQASILSETIVFVVFTVGSFHSFNILFRIENLVPAYLGIFQEHQAPHLLIGLFAGGTS